MWDKEHRTAPKAKAGGVVPLGVAVILGKDKIFTAWHLCGLYLVTFSDDLFILADEKEKNMGETWSVIFLLASMNQRQQDEA